MPEPTPAMDGLYYFRETPERIADGIHLISAFGNSACIETTDGLVIVDTCVRPMGARLLEQIRRISDQPIRYVVYTHGHFDHAFGVWALLEEAERRGVTVWGEVELATRALLHPAPDAVDESVAKRHRQGIAQGNAEFGIRCGIERRIVTHPTPPSRC